MGGVDRSEDLRGLGLGHVDEDPCPPLPVRQDGEPVLVPADELLPLVMLDEQ